MNAPIVLKYPAWHDEARRDKNRGDHVDKIADRYGVTRGRISQIATPNWKAYLVLWRERRADSKMGVNDGIKAMHKYTFVPEIVPSPAEIEATKKAAKKPVQRTEDVPMARVREFEEVREFDGAKVKIGARITCCKCRKTEDYYKNGGSVNPAYLEKEFARLGWFVGKSKSMDMCPDDLAKLNGAKIKAPEDSKPVPIVTQKVMSSTSIMPAVHAGIQDVMAQPKGLEAIGVKLGHTLKEVPMPTVTPAKIEDKPFVPSFKVTGALPIEPAVDLTKPILEQVVALDRKMTRADDQIVYLKLMDVYVDERSGYKDDWTDAKVAAELGVPQDWVSLVRDRSFGPEINPVMRQKAHADLTKLGEDVERTILLCDKKMEQMQALDDKLVAVQSAIAADIDRYEQLIKNLETEDKHIETLINGFDAKVEEFKKMFAETKALTLA